MDEPMSRALQGLVDPPARQHGYAPDQTQEHMAADPACGEPQRRASGRSRTALVAARPRVPWSPRPCRQAQRAACRSQSSHHRCRSGRCRLSRSDIQFACRAFVPRWAGRTRSAVSTARATRRNRSHIGAERNHLWAVTRHLPSPASRPRVAPADLVGACCTCGGQNSSTRPSAIRSARSGGRVAQAGVAEPGEGDPLHPHSRAG